MPLGCSGDVEKNWSVGGIGVKEGMMRAGPGIIASLFLSIAAGAPAAAAPPQILTIFAAGTLAGPFRAIAEVFQKQHPGVEVRPEFGGSVKMAKQITELHRRADILATADYRVIPKYLFGGAGRPGDAEWYAGFARNAITFVYTDKSKGAPEVTSQNWYQVLARPGVEIGRSNPDTDPSGYQTLQMLDLAGRYYRDPGLGAKILANAPARNMRDTESSLISALELGQIDYLAIYRSDAIQHHLKYLALPAQIDLSDPKSAALYAQAVAHTRNGDLKGAPIVYAVTIPRDAEHPGLAAEYVKLLLGPIGQQILAKSGFGGLSPAAAVNSDKMPAELRPLVVPWPSS
jgi:molybdate/tungstate transport system substrate-binding protein